MSGCRTAKPLFPTPSIERNHSHTAARHYCLPSISFHVHKTAELPNGTTLKWIFYSSAFPVSDVPRRKPTQEGGGGGDSSCSMNSHSFAVSLGPPAFSISLTAPSRAIFQTLVFITSSELPAVTSLKLHVTVCLSGKSLPSVAYRGEKRGFNPPKFQSFDKAEPNSQFRGIYIRNNVIRIRV
jgi:hypothetical protein